MDDLETKIKERRRGIARKLLEFRRTREQGGYEFDQSQHWFYCLSECLGWDRLKGEDFWTWVARVAA